MEVGFCSVRKYESVLKSFAKKGPKFANLKQATETERRCAKMLEWLKTENERERR